ncbi:MAG: hypothetical protein INR71_02190 [Terriglobus roseus]|nr:hypothetical protein [Terriglobus roseus]
MDKAVAMSARDDEVSQVPDQLMDQLLKGYDALHSEFKLLNQRQQELERKLAWAKQQVTHSSVS